MSFPDIHDTQIVELYGKCNKLAHKLNRLEEQVAYLIKDLERPEIQEEKEQPEIAPADFLPGPYNVSLSVDRPDVCVVLGPDNEVVYSSNENPGQTAGICDLLNKAFKEGRHTGEKDGYDIGYSRGIRGFVKSMQEIPQ